MSQQAWPSQRSGLRGCCSCQGPASQERVAHAGRALATRAYRGVRRQQRRRQAQGMAVLQISSRLIRSSRRLRAHRGAAFNAGRRIQQRAVSWSTISTSTPPKRRTASPTAAGAMLDWAAVTTAAPHSESTAPVRLFAIPDARSGDFAQQGAVSTASARNRRSKPPCDFGGDVLGRRQAQ